MVFEKIKAIIAEKLDVDASLVEISSRFDDMQIDSLYMVEIMLSIEEEFEITIDEADGLETIGDLVEYVEKKLA
ncbi:MAG: acyl carrier protein [Bacillota bacterium]|nr:acyl carrier protein [Bacillota bacterium]